MSLLHNTAGFRTSFDRSRAARRARARRTGGRACTPLADRDRLERCREASVWRAVEHLRAEEFFAELNRAYDRLHADASALAEEAAEREEWEETLADGLEVDGE